MECRNASLTQIPPLDATTQVLKFKMALAKYGQYPLKSNHLQRYVSNDLRVLKVKGLLLFMSKL